MPMLLVCREPGSDIQALVTDPATVIPINAALFAPTSCESKHNFRDLFLTLRLFLSKERHRSIQAPASDPFIVLAINILLLATPFHISAQKIARDSCL